MPISVPPTSLDEYLFFISLVVGLPYSLIFCQFWLFFVFKLLSFWLCEEAKCVYLCLHLGQKFDHFVSWLCYFLSLFMCPLIFCWKLDILCRTVEIKVNSIYAWKWSCFFFCQVFSIGGWINIDRRWAGVEFCCYYGSFLCTIGFNPLALLCVWGGSWVAGRFPTTVILFYPQL